MNDKISQLKSILLEEDIVLSINNNLSFLLEIIPEIKDMIGFEQRHPHHHLDVWNHTLLALSKSSNIFEVRLSLLLHDIGKPHSYQDEEVRHFRHHAEVSSDMAATILHRIGLSEKQTNYICELIKYHDTPITEEQITTNREFCCTLYQIQYCDALAHHPDKLTKRINYLKSIQGKLLNKNELTLKKEHKE